MAKAVLFDLDNTLLENDMGIHIPTFLDTLAPKFAGLIPPKVFKQWMLRSVRQMIVDLDPRATNREVFVHDLVMRSGYSWARLGPIFEDYYANDYAGLGSLTRAISLAPRVVEEALERGLTVAVATNPIFPREGIVERLRWARLDALPFALVTSYDDMHFCKPHPEYFAEVAERLGLDAGNCLMVGDDRANDLPAAEAGLKTFLVTDHADARKRSRYTPTWTGTLEELAKLLASPRRVAAL